MSRQRLTCVLTSAVLSALVLAGCDARYPPMPDAWEPVPVPTHTPSASLPTATDEGAGPDGSLLGAYAERTPRQDDDVEAWMLPFQAKAMIVELLIAAAKDDPHRMNQLLSENARWGVPDRRELRARPIMHDGDPLGLEFLDAFRRATSRFAAKSSFTCTPLQPGWQMLAAAGAEPMWCSYTSADSLDIIGFRLIVEQGQVVTDYIGFFEQRQPFAIRVPDAGDPPNITPYVKLPVSLTLPQLMPDGSNPVIEKKPARQPEPEPEPAPEPEPEPEVEPTPEPEPADAPIPVEPKPKQPAKPADDAAEKPAKKPAKPADDAAEKPAKKPAKPADAEPGDAGE
ncbi:hypothetical protein [Enhygromyxa salina]|uniref:Uncharacterized protein n=1 Tax=Enhygromyxa salina TaxID=215803 RepID=A0A2S9XS56_9BACT|nr:hypothetical protein [Enhygromyxa salina]PRP95695.1 hypothetical protein ENSA7_73290 [Enhygromyxa salina]